MKINSSNLSSNQIFKLKQLNLTLSGIPAFSSFKLLGHHGNVETIWLSVQNRELELNYADCSKPLVFLQQNNN